MPVIKSLRQHFHQEQVLTWNRGSGEDLDVMLHMQSSSPPQPTDCFQNMTGGWLEVSRAKPGSICNYDHNSDEDSLEWILWLVISRKEERVSHVWLRRRNHRHNQSSDRRRHKGQLPMQLAKRTSLPLSSSLSLSMSMSFIHGNSIRKRKEQERARRCFVFSMCAPWSPIPTSSPFRPISSRLNPSLISSLDPLFPHFKLTDFRHHVKLSLSKQTDSSFSSSSLSSSLKRQQTVHSLHFLPHKPQWKLFQSVYLHHLLGF